MLIFAVFSVLLVLSVLLSACFHRTLLSAAALFLIAGIACGEGGFGLGSVSPDWVAGVTRAALVAVLFNDPMRISRRELVAAWRALRREGPVADRIRWSRHSARAPTLGAERAVPLSLGVPTAPGRGVVRAERLRVDAVLIARLPPRRGSARASGRSTRRRAVARATIAGLPPGRGESSNTSWSTAS